MYIYNYLLSLLFLSLLLFYYCFLFINCFCYFVFCFSGFFCVFGFTFFFFLLIKQLLFSHETVKFSGFHCFLFVCLIVCLFACRFYFLSWNCRVIIDSLVTFLQFPKGLQFYSFIFILTWLYISFWIFY